MTYTQPLLSVFLLLAFWGLLRNRKKLIFVGLLGLFATSWPIAEWLFARPLERAYPVRPFQAPDGLQAIVVFSGGVEPPLYERPYPSPNLDTVERCEYAAWIYRRHPLPVVACGGLPAYAAEMRDLLRRSGVPDDRIWTEDRSRNTYENALYAAGILRAHGVDRVALVVDARSMPRAAACLRKQGMHVVPAPSKFRRWDTPFWQELTPKPSAVKGNEETLHEIVGLAWYRLRGWI
jgi:uncharacterized SAM-binding protein YcdF (DUF218 family)